MEIASHNPFDAYTQLKAFRKQYKQSEFYKANKISLQSAYKMFLTMLPGQLYSKIDNFTDVEKWAAKITAVINGIDEDAINGLMNRLTNTFNLDELQDEKGDLKILLNQIKDLVK